MSDWQDISTAPKDGTRLLLWMREWAAPSTGQYYGESSGWGMFWDGAMYRFQPTHWMPLPAPPHSKEIEG